MLKNQNNRDYFSDDAYRHWERVKARVNVRLAAVVFCIVLVSAVIIIQVFAGAFIGFYYDVNREVNYKDMTALNDAGDLLLQDYLASEKEADAKECVIIGASYVAAGIDPLPGDRIQGKLERRLEEATGEEWSCTNLASDGLVTWCYFYLARILRLRKPPDLMIISIDTMYPNDRSGQLLLNVGASFKEITPLELRYAVPLNNVLLYVGEANYKKWLRDKIAFFKAINYMSWSYPKRTNLKSWTVFLFARLFQREVSGLEPPAYINPNGTPKSWREIPGNKAVIDFFNRTGGMENELKGWMIEEFELLFTELVECEEAGIRVILVTMPRNPAMEHHLDEVQDYLSEATTRYNLQFRDYWPSGTIPEDCYYDYGHFIGAGNDIMAEEILKLYLEDKK
ncbi:hypothetical protein J7K50_07500 [bacterium]|nr:hypothetical protein [bacterium]